MSQPENSTNVRDPEETCSQFIFGRDFYYVDNAYNHVKSKDSGYRPVLAGEQLQEHDIVFYTDFNGEAISHVGRVNADGRIESKFYKGTSVVIHEVWGEEIPLSFLYEAYVAFRKK